MIPAPFEYARAESIDHAIELLGSSEDAKILAGGHSLLPLMRFRLARPDLLVDIGRVWDLSYVREDGDHVAIGALTRHHDVANAEVLQTLCPIVAHTAEGIGDPQVRHMGTIGGSVAHADPASDMPTVLVALGAELVVTGVGGASRTVNARDFFKGLFTADLAHDEVLTEIRVPKTAGGWSYMKFHRRAQDWAMVGVAAVMNGGAHVALTNMGETPLVAAGRRGGARGRRRSGRRGGARGRGHRPSLGRLRQCGVPEGTREGPGAPRPRGGDGLAQRDPPAVPTSVASGWRFRVTSCEIRGRVGASDGCAPLPPPTFGRGPYRRSVASVPQQLDRSLRHPRGSNGSAPSAERGASSAGRSHSRSCCMPPRSSPTSPRRSWDRATPTRSSTCGTLHGGRTRSRQA